MSKQKRVKESTTTEQQVDNEELIEDSAEVETASISDDLDGLLDEIDDVLEVNAEDFIRNYVQKGGQ